MIKNVIVNTEPTLLVEASTSNLAVILITFTNISELNKKIELYAVQNGKVPPTYDSTGNLIAGNIETIMIKEKILQPNDTFILNLEKFLLAPGDKLYARCVEDGNSIVITIAYEEY